MGRLKIRADDTAFSLCVRERSGWRCERCGNQFQIGQARGLDCSHYFSRKAYSTRHHPLNAFAHCRGCHQHLGSNPELFREHYIEVLGEENLETLKTIHNDLTLGKRIKKCLPDITKHLRSEHEKQLALRAEGNPYGRAEFEAIPYDIIC